MTKNRKLSLAALILAAVMLMTACGAFAEATLTDYTSENLTFSFGGGEWYHIGDSNGVPTYCSTPTVGADSKAFLVLEQDVGMEATQLGPDILKTVLETVVKNQNGEDLQAETITAANGAESLKFSYKQGGSGLTLTAYGVLIPVGNEVLIVFYTGISAEDGSERMDAVANSVKPLK